MIEKLKPVKFEESIKEHTDWKPLSVAMGASFKMVGSCDAQVVVVLMHRIRLLEEFVLSLPIEGVVDDKCYIKYEEEEERDDRSWL